MFLGVVGGRVAFSGWVLRDFGVERLGSWGGRLFGALVRRWACVGGVAGGCRASSVARLFFAHGSYSACGWFAEDSLLVRDEDSWHSLASACGWFAAGSGESLLLLA